jgi:translation initiation factor 2 subunit 2
MDEYGRLLDEAYAKVKKVSAGSNDRFEMPKAEGHFEGKKTIVTNFSQIAGYLRRDLNHLQKFIFRELATSGQMEGDRLVLNNKIPSSKINQKMEEYAKEFVLCKQCGKPDTEIIREERMSFMKCFACGARNAVRGKI